MKNTLTAILLSAFAGPLLLAAIVFVNPSRFSSGGGGIPVIDLVELPMSEGTGTDVFNAIDGQPEFVTNASWADGGLSLNGSSQSLYSASALNLSSTKNISFSFWWYLNSSAGTQVVLETSSIFDTHDKCLVSYISGGYFYTALRGGSSTSIYHAHVQPPTTGQWVHTVITLTSSWSGSGYGTLVVYYDGVAQTTFNDNDTLPSDYGLDDYVLNVGARNNASYWMNAKLNKLQVYRSILSQSDVTAIFNQGR